MESFENKTRLTSSCLPGKDETLSKRQNLTQCKEDELTNKMNVIAENDHAKIILPVKHNMFFEPTLPVSKAIDLSTSNNSLRMEPFIPNLSYHYQGISNYSDNLFHNMSINTPKTEGIQQDCKLENQDTMHPISHKVVRDSILKKCETVTSNSLEVINSKINSCAITVEELLKTTKQNTNKSKIIKKIPLKDEFSVTKSSAQTFNTPSNTAVKGNILNICNTYSFNDCDKSMLRQALVAMPSTSAQKLFFKSNFPEPKISTERSYFFVPPSNNAEVIAIRPNAFEEKNSVQNFKTCGLVVDDKQALMPTASGTGLKLFSGNSFEKNFSVEVNHHNYVPNMFQNSVHKISNETISQGHCTTNYSSRYVSYTTSEAISSKLSTSRIFESFTSSSTNEALQRNIIQSTMMLETDLCKSKTTSDATVCDLSKSNNDLDRGLDNTDHSKVDNLVDNHDSDTSHQEIDVTGFECKSDDTDIAIENLFKKYECFTQDKSVQATPESLDKYSQTSPGKVCKRCLEFHDINDSKKTKLEDTLVSTLTASIVPEHFENICTENPSDDSLFIDVVNSSPETNEEPPNAWDQDQQVPTGYIEVPLSPEELEDMAEEAELLKILEALRTHPKPPPTPM